LIDNDKCEKYRASKNYSGEQDIKQIGEGKVCLLPFIRISSVEVLIGIGFLDSHTNSGTGSGLSLRWVNREGFVGTNQPVCPVIVCHCDERSEEAICEFAEL